MSECVKLWADSHAAKEALKAVTRRTVLVTGATGFIGRALVSGLAEGGFQVVAASRNPPPTGQAASGVLWRRSDLLQPETLPGLLQGVEVAYYLVHSMGAGHEDFRELERRSARTFADAAAKARVARIVYLGGPAPKGRPSEHLGSRLEVGEILRSGTVPTLELRASMVIGRGSASWQIVRDLALRLPMMVLPRWLKSRTRPIALDDVVAALVGGADIPLTKSAWFDLPGPETLSGRQILERIAGLRGRRILALEVPFLTPALSALWLKLVTRTDFAVARALVAGLTEDLLPDSDGYWKAVGKGELISFDEAGRRALAAEADATGAKSEDGPRSGRGDLAPKSYLPSLLLLLTSVVWLAGFALLQSRGTWLTFAVAGPILATLSVSFDTGTLPLLRPSVRKLALGLTFGLLMVALTRAAFAGVSPLLPAARASTLRLVELFYAGGFPLAVRVVLIVVIAASEEILFRGTVADARGAGQRPSRRGPRVAALAAIYAFASLSLGSPLLVLCAFCCGLAWGALRVATGSLIPSMVAHVVWDVGVLVVFPPV